MIEKLNKIFRNGQKLFETDLNPMSAKVDEIIDVVNAGSDLSNANDINVASTHPEDISPDGASIVLREANRMGAGSGTVYNSQAPRIGFNWKGRWWAQILMTSNVFKFVRGKDDTAWAGIQAGVIQGSEIKTFDGANLAEVKQRLDGITEQVGYNGVSGNTIYSEGGNANGGKCVPVFGSTFAQHNSGRLIPRWRLWGNNNGAAIYANDANNPVPRATATHDGVMSGIDKTKLDGLQEYVVPDYYIDNDGKLYVKNYTYKSGDVIYMVRHIKSKYGASQTIRLTGEEHPRYRVRGPIKSHLAIATGQSSGLHGGTEIKPADYTSFVSYMEEEVEERINLDRKCEIIIKRGGKVYMSGIRFRVKINFKYNKVTHTKDIEGYFMSLW